jgi:hypothetical protein
MSNKNIFDIVKQLVPEHMSIRFQKKSFNCKSVKLCEEEVKFIQSSSTKKENGIETKFTLKL